MKDNNDKLNTLYEDLFTQKSFSSNNKQQDQIYRPGASNENNTYHSIGRKPLEQIVYKALFSYLTNNKETIKTLMHSIILNNKDFIYTLITQSLKSPDNQNMIHALIYKAVTNTTKEYMDNKFNIANNQP